MNHHQLKHKAQHRGYKSHPTKRAIINLMKMYSDVSRVVRQRPVKRQVGVQLKLNF